MTAVVPVEGLVFFGGLRCIVAHYQYIRSSQDTNQTKMVESYF